MPEQIPLMVDAATQELRQFASDETIPKGQLLAALQVALTGLVTSNVSGVLASDTILQALGKLQAQTSNKVDKVSGKQLSTEDYTSAEKTKLAGIAAGAQVNSVTSVAGRTGAIVLSKADVGLSNVDNTADSAKPVSTAQQTALNLKANLASPALTGTPTAPTAATATNTTQLATTAFVQGAVGGKVDKVAGKQLSTEDYTSAEKAKLSGIAAGATANSTDANLRDRTTHTGIQPIESVSGLSVALPLLIKTAPEAPCLIKTSATTLAIKAGTHVKIGNGYVSLVAQTTVTMPAVLTPGEDYAVFVHPDGAASAVADPFFAPAATPVPGALKIGGFHYGLVAPGTTPASGGFATTGFTNTGGNYPWTQARVDRIAGINAFSIWDLTHRSKGEQHGFAFDPQRKVWVAIYFCSPDHITNGLSRYNTPAASGTVLPKIPLEYGGDGVMTYGRLSAYEALEILASHGCRLMTQDEFASGALGVTEGQSLGGAASTIPATKREPGYTSRIGLEQATGHIWTIGGPLTSVSGGAWTAGPNRGNFYGGAGLPLFGGARDNAVSSGSRVSYWGSVFWGSNWHTGLRAACDHHQGAY